MKSINLIFAVLLLLCTLNASSQVGIDNTTPDPSSVLDLASTDKGVLIPRMTSAQRLAIAAPGTSLLVFDTTVGTFYYYNGTSWNTLESWNKISGGISYTGQVAVNTTTPSASAALDLTSTSKGILIPRMTTVERQAIVAPTRSLLVFDTTVGTFYYYSGSEWNTLESWSRISGGVSYTGQVGVNTTTPNASATLDLTSTNKGILIPRMTTPQRLAIASPSTSLLVFDTTEGKFYFYTGTQWATLNSFDQNSGNTTATHNGNVVINGTLTATNINGVNSVPTGAIIMWAGTTPPAGWALCNGADGTPDLRGRFIVGFDPGTGTPTRTRDPDYDAIGKPNDIAGKRAIAVDNLPAHNHTYLDVYFVGNTQPMPKPWGTVVYENLGTTVTGDDGNDDNNNIAVKKSFNTSNNSTTNAAFDVRPPYYTLAYIIKQ